MNLGTRAKLGVVVGLAAWSVASPVLARGKALEAVTLGTEKVRIDGLLREWPQRLDALSDVLQGSAAGGDPSASGVIGYDDKNVYAVLKIKDKKLVRTSSFGDHEDYATVELAFPTEHGFASHPVRLYAGVIGKSAGAVKLDGSSVRGAKIVEAPSDGGYTIEASIPWGAFPEAARVRAGLRAALKYTDVDSGGGVHAVIATSSGSGSGLPPLLLEAEQGLERNLVRGKGLSEMPARFAVGDLCGDSQLEVIAVYGSSLTVLGSGYRSGKEFFFQDLQVPDAAAVTRLDVQDLTGDGKDDIVIGKRIGTKDEYREVLQVLRVSSGDNPYVAFQQETAIVTKTGEIRNEVAFKKKGGKVDIVLSQGKAEGFDPATYAEPMPGDMDSALLPWQSIKSRTFEWDGKTFSDAGSETWQPTMKAPVARAAAPSQSEGPPPPPPPRPPSPDELLDRVYALYRKDRSVGIEKPRFDFVTDVSSDRTPERVLIHGKDIVVFGKAYKQGTSYAFITIGVESPKDVLDVTARDLTGDGKAEIVVRGVLHAKASKEMGGKTVYRHAFFVYGTTESGVKRIFAAETGRSLGDDAIVGGVRFVPKGKGTALELTPGRAIGWTEKTYPFPIDKFPYGGLEALLVPWGDVPVKRYHFDGSAFVADE